MEKRKTRINIKREVKFLVLCELLLPSKTVTVIANLSQESSGPVTMSEGKDKKS